MTAMNPYPFPHEKLDAWHVAREARIGLHELMAQLPRGQHIERREVDKSAGSVLRNIAEGATRRGKGEKRQHFNIANAEAAEVAASVQGWVDAQMVDIDAAYRVIRLYGRVGAMMVGLVRMHGG
jgi:four helix bundle protein